MDTGHLESGQQPAVCRIGEKAAITKTFTAEDIAAFAQLSLDDNGIHVDPEVSRRGIFRRPVVHGVLVAALISSVMGTKLPGSGTVLRDQSVEYLNPTYPGDTITAEVELVSVEEQERYYIAEFAGTCRNQDDIVCVRATCHQLMLKRFFRVMEATCAE